VLGLDQNALVSEGERVVLSTFPPGPAPTQVLYTVDDGVQVTASGPDYSLGGDRVDGNPSSYSFVGLKAGPHTFKVSATYADGSTAERRVPYGFVPLAQAIPTWAVDIQPIFQDRCAKCHVSGPGPDLSTYDLWKKDATNIVTYLREQRMPADGPLDPDSILKVERWVQGGTPP
jgi:mono/diheme cytochrome c family protein